MDDSKNGGRKDTSLEGGGEIIYNKGISVLLEGWIISRGWWINITVFRKTETGFWRLITRLFVIEFMYEDIDNDDYKALKKKTNIKWIWLIEIINKLIIF